MQAKSAKMRSYFILFSFILSISAFAQNKSDTINSRDGDLASLEIIYGNHFYKSPVNNQFNSLKSFNLYQPVQSVGLSFTNVYIINRERKQTMHISYSQIIPQTVFINDTLKSKINGYVFSINLVSFDITKNSKSMSTPFGLGFNTGRLKLQSDSYKPQKNPFFAPAFFLNPRFLIGKVVLGVRFDYQFDISRKGWRSVINTKKDLSFPVKDFNQTGLIVNLSLGWNLFK